MRTIPFQSVLYGVIRRLGLNPEGEISSDLGGAIVDHINDRVRAGLSAWPWPETIRTEQRYFTPVYDNTAAYTTGKRVYWPASLDGDDLYHEAIADTIAGQDPSNAAKWKVVYLGQEEQLIELEQTGQAAIGEIFQVYQTNPFASSGGWPAAYFLNNTGILILSGVNSAWIRYRTANPAFTIRPPVGDTQKGQVVYVAKAKECYQAIADTDDDPANTATPDPAKWSKVDFPEFLANYVKAGATCDCLRENNPDNETAEAAQVRLAKANAAESEADNSLQREIDRTVAQTGWPRYATGRVMGGCDRARLAATAALFILIGIVWASPARGQGTRPPVTKMSKLSDVTTTGLHLGTLPDPNAETFLRINANNTVDALSAPAFRSAIGVSTGGGTGDVVGPSSSVDAEIALFNGTSGKSIKRGTGNGVVSLTSGVVSLLSIGTTAGTLMAGNDSRVTSAVPNTRQVNGHALNNDVTITSGDIYGTAASRGLDKTIYIAFRSPSACGSNGMTGCAGTAEDPYDGSTAARFDAILTSLVGVNNVTLYLGPGTYNTNGGNLHMLGYSAGWNVGDNWTIIGAGRDSTSVVQQTLLDNSSSAVGQNGVFSGGYKCRIENLTVDANYATLKAAHPDPAYVHSGNYGICIKSGTLRNLRIKGAGGADDIEVFAAGFFVTGTGSTQPDLVTIDNVTVDTVAGTNTTGLWASASSTNDLSESAPSGGTAIIRNSYVNGANIGYQINGFKNGMVDGNTAVSCNYGFLHDTARIRNLTISRNSFSCTGGTISLLGSYETDKVNISSNWLTLTVDTPNISTDSATHVRIDNNTLICVSGGAFWHPIQTSNDGTNIITNNWFSSDSSTTLRAGSLTGRFWGNRKLDGTTYSLLPDNDPAAFGKISVATQSDVVADSSTDTLTIAAGSNVTITTNASTDTVTINAVGSGLFDGKFTSLDFTGGDTSLLPDSTNKRYVRDADLLIIADAPTVLTATATLDFPNTPAQKDSNLTVAVTGAAVGDPVRVGVGLAAQLDGAIYDGQVNATDQVQVRCNNYSANAINPASASFKVFVFKH